MSNVRVMCSQDTSKLIINTTGRALLSDWFTNSFIMLVCENSILSLNSQNSLFTKLFREPLEVNTLPTVMMCSQDFRKLLIRNSSFTPGHVFFLTKT